jgi:hypothetical protein
MILFTHADPSCTLCHGLGSFRTPMFQKPSVCKCVLRFVTRRTFERYRQIQAEVGYAPKNPVLRQAKNGNYMFSFPDVEWCADVEIACKGLDYTAAAVCRFYFREGLCWDEAIDKVAAAVGVRLTQVQLHQQLSRICIFLGRKLLFQKPFALFPYHEYVRSRVPSSNPFPKKAPTDDSTFDAGN